MTRKRGLVHFCHKTMQRDVLHQSRKGDRSIFRLRLRAAPRLIRKDGPVPFSRPGFTLFELILSIALSAVFLSLIGMAINLYLKRVDASRSRVEEAQIARSVLAMIADDIRATTIYQPQNTSAIAQLMASNAAFDVDSIDKAKSAGLGTPGGTGGVGGVGASSTVASIASSSTSQTSTGNSSSNSSETDNTLPLGVNGSLDELYVDPARLPKQEELFTTTTGYTNAPSPTADGAAGGSTSSGVAPPTDLKNVHYFVRPGDAVEPGSAGSTSLDPAAQLRAGGLVRQEIPRAARLFAEQNGGSDVLDSGEVLIAPEVVHIEFRYFDGSQITDTWDMKEQKALPVAIEVCVWVRSSAAADQPITSTFDASALASSSREYRQRVYLPMAQLMNSSSSSDSSSADSSSTDSSTSSSSSQSGSSFDQTQ